MVPSRRQSDRNLRLIPVRPLEKLARCTSIQDVLNELAEIARQRGVNLHSVKFIRSGLVRVFHLQTVESKNKDLSEFEAGVEGGLTHLVLRLQNPVYEAVLYEIEEAIQLAAHRIELLSLTGKGLQRGKKRSIVSSVIEGFVGNSEPMVEVVEEIAIAAARESMVLITGESGTGKELVARAVHNWGRRTKGPFIPVNCSAFAESLLESELFGYVKGAFTGAAENRKGLFEAAEGGTIFLDEIGAVTLPTQHRLLRMLQERKNRPLGAHQKREVDVRVIAATNRDLPHEIREGRFCLDLFYRLNVLSIQMPSLRDHLSDIPLLIEHFLNVMKERHGYIWRPKIETSAVDLLYRYPWPGNVRELEAIVERLSAKAGDGGSITKAQARREIVKFERLATMLGDKGLIKGTQVFHETSIKPASLHDDIEYSAVLFVGEPVRDHSRRRDLTLLTKVLELAGGDYSKAAERLGLGCDALYNRMYRLRQQAAQADNRTPGR